MAYLREQLRHATYDAIYVSPHMDDAAYSCGGRILQQRARGERVLVVTLFGTGRGASGEGGGNALTDYAQRSAEEEAVMAALDADFVWLDYPELLFRPKRLGEIARFLLPYLPLPPSAVGDDLLTLLGELFAARLAPGGSVHFPLGVGFHPDHRIVTDVGRALHGLGAFSVLFYEDIPYSTVPAFVALRLATLGLDARAPFVEAVRTIHRFAFRPLGVIGLLGLPVVAAYLLFLRAAGLLSGRHDVLPGEPKPLREELEIGDVVERKVAAMRLYPTQTALFFEPGQATFEALRREGGYREYSWRFPAFAEPRARLAGPVREPLAAKLRARFGA